MKHTKYKVIKDSVYLDVDIKDQLDGFDPRIFIDSRDYDEVKQQRDKLLEALKLADELIEKEAEWESPKAYFSGSLKGLIAECEDK